MAAKTKSETLAWLRSLTGELSTATLRELDRTLPWYREMPPGRRSAVGLVAQTGISSFATWYENPGSSPWVASDVFGTAPRELLRSISLQQTLQLIRVVVAVVEERIKRSDDAELSNSFLMYSREVAFAAADVYARAAEARGLWDARLEALVVDSILSGEYDDELSSRIAALGWHGHGEVAVLVGVAPDQLDVDRLRRTSRHNGFDVLVGVQGQRLVVVIGRSIGGSTAGHEKPAEGQEKVPVTFVEAATKLADHFGPGYLVLGTEVASVVDASTSARSALAGFAVARASRNAPRPVLADDLLPERALAGDPLARQTLIERIYTPLRDYQTDLISTLWAYLDNGRSLEATARELYVHPNTVRYRLKRVGEVIGWDATGAREAQILHSALVLGTIAEQPSRIPLRRRPPRDHR